MKTLARTFDRASKIIDFKSKSETFRVGASLVIGMYTEKFYFKWQNVLYLN